jgi:glycosyltransferase involved in cell wall biosynthesis
VVTDIRGCRQTVDHGVSGLIVPVRDPVALADALDQLLRSPADRARMGAAGRVKALREFDEHRIIASIVRTYRDLARKHFGSVAEPSATVAKSR